MKEKQTEWLPHLTEAVTAKAEGPLLDSYAVALEGWRRGLTLRWHVKDSERFREMYTWYVDEPGQLFSLSSGEKTHYFFRTRGDLVANEAVKIGKDKEWTKEMLKKSEVRVPEGGRFSSNDTDQKIREYVSTIGYPVVLKPVDNSFGRGVVPGIYTKEELDYALIYVRSELKIKDVIVEQHIPGNEYRIYVVDDQVAAAINRIPANVIGDGIHSIDTLIKKKNNGRNTNPRLISCPIHVDYETEVYLNKSNRSLDSVPKENESVFLTDKSNISSGGDPIDVLDELPEEIKALAIDTVQAIPGLVHGAVDIMIHSEKPIEEAGFVLEINPTAQIGSLLYPLQGKARDVPAQIIDYYFPETIGATKSKPLLYFDIEEALVPLANKAAEVSEIAHLPLEDWFFKKYILYGKMDGMEFFQKVKEKALEKSLVGRVYKSGFSRIEVVVGGTDREEIDRFRDELYELDIGAAIENIEVQPWNQPIQFGFEIEGERKNVLNELDALEDQFIKLSTQQRKLEKHYRNMLTSNSWKLTEPFRKIGGSLKSIIKGR